MNSIRNCLIGALVALPMIVGAQEVIVTRSFTGLWDQPEHESQGVNLQVIDQVDGDKVGLVYWFTYGNDGESAWFLGAGPVVGNRVDMVLYEGRDIGFLEDDKPGDERVMVVGSMQMEFSSCMDGVVRFTTQVDGVDSGSFRVRRLTQLFNTQCSGGISDDTPADVSPGEQRIRLTPARQGISGSGHADFEVRVDRIEFSVEVEDLSDGAYRIVVGGIDRGGLSVNLNAGETEFRSPAEPGKVLLSFDPRGEPIEVHDELGVVLTSGEALIDGNDPVDENGDDGNDNLDFGTGETEVRFDNTGVFPLASGEAQLESREDRTDFSVEIEDVPQGNYVLLVGGLQVGIIEAALREDGSIEGELEFRNPVEPGKILLDFDPRGLQISVLDGSIVILQTTFPST